VFEEPVIESPFSQKAGQANAAIILQEIIGSPGRFFIGNKTTLFQMYRNGSRNWTVEVIVGTDAAHCIDGKILSAAISVSDRDV